MSVSPELESSRISTVVAPAANSGSDASITVCKLVTVLVMVLVAPPVETKKLPAVIPPPDKFIASAVSTTKGVPAVSAVKFMTPVPAPDVAVMVAALVPALRAMTTLAAMLLSSCADVATPPVPSPFAVKSLAVIV